MKFWIFLFFAILRKVEIFDSQRKDLYYYPKVKIPAFNSRLKII